MALDIAWARKDYGRVRALIDSVDRGVGGDPYLDSIRADAYLHASEFPRAVEYARRATTGAAMVASCWWMLATAQTAMTDFAAAVATLEQLHKRFSADVSADALGVDERFMALVESPVYKSSGLAARVR